MPSVKAIMDSLELQLRNFPMSTPLFVVNRVSGVEHRREAIRNYHTTSCIENDPLYEQRGPSGAFQWPFLGYSHLYTDIRDCLYKMLTERDQTRLLPGPVVARLTPWWELLIQGKLAQKELESRGFKVRQAVAFAAPIVAGLAFVVFSALEIARYAAARAQEVSFKPDLAFPLAATLALGLGLWYLLARFLPVRRLLRKIAKLGPEYDAQHVELLESLRRKEDECLQDYLIELVCRSQQAAPWEGTLRRR